MYPLKKLQHGFAVRRQTHLCAQRHVQIKIVAKRAICVHRWTIPLCSSDRTENSGKSGPHRCAYEKRPKCVELSLNGTVDAMSSVTQSTERGSDSSSPSQGNTKAQVTPEVRCFLEMFPSEFGWIGMVADPKMVLYLTFGRNSQMATFRTVKKVFAADIKLAVESDRPRWLQMLVDRIGNYTQGAVEEFQNVKIDLRDATPFQCKVLNACRCIPFGATATYGELARRCGSPRAARAVGRVMATNPIPLIVPCHRVVSSGSLNGFSAFGGVAVKARLLAMEGSAIGGC
ncbi:MAG: MGMT family protein [Pirellulales bacterium]